ncbi:sensor histidine kinase [Paenibacillus sp. GSMTC-2017]|uniref:sensor histidine kinase n=1 Tax=Paenibacillus sp. GSMTC-2017 TaxID=2794350 RepID=UPI0018D5BA3A|nr:sensor histidine kinase [Paenibacillus sp. GSMTC-2017]MBH5316216.1 sensor histidine kinase [Paenibacillus sp. GSMTC-2017]
MYITITTVQTISNIKVAKLIFYGLATAYIMLLIVYIGLSQFKGILFVPIIIGLYYLRHTKLVLHDPKHQLFAALFPIVEIILLFLYFLQSDTGIENIVFVIIIADILLHYKPWFAFPIAYGGYITYNLLWPAGGEGLWRNVFEILSYSCVIILIWSTKQLLNQRDMNYLLNEAMIREAGMREEMAVLRERTMIAEEVHDTVGHTLTTAIVALEGAQLLFEKSPEEALRKIFVAREQMKQGLGNIRQVVKTLKAKEGNTSGLNLKDGIYKIISDTTKQTDTQIDFYYNVTTPFISLQEYVIINAIKESITNALKHGKARSIEITVLEQQETIHLKIRDDGCGNDFLEFGFGLKTMEERVEAIGGRLTVQSDLMKGFLLHMQMPVARGLVDG